MESAVGWILVFCLALRAEGELLHRGVRPVVREGFNDAETGTAVGAIGEGIEKAAILRIEDFAQAIRTGGDVRQDEGGLFAARLAGADGKFSIADSVEPGGFEALNETAGRFFGLEAQQELLEIGPRAFGFNEDALGGVVHPAP
jgi:hypothetical protein